MVPCGSHREALIENASKFFHQTVPSGKEPVLGYTSRFLDVYVVFGETSFAVVEAS
jgi:hypothetical protein